MRCLFICKPNLDKTNQCKGQKGKKWNKSNQYNIGGECKGNEGKEEVQREGSEREGESRIGPLFNHH